jgi:hypothetical protein
LNIFNDFGFSFEISKRTALFWVLDPLKMAPIVCPETSIRNYHYSLRNNPEERSSHLLRGESLKSRFEISTCRQQKAKYL